VGTCRHFKWQQEYVAATVAAVGVPAWALQSCPQLKWQKVPVANWNGDRSPLGGMSLQASAGWWLCARGSMRSQLLYCRQLKWRQVSARWDVTTSLCWMVIVYAWLDAFPATVLTNPFPRQVKMLHCKLNWSSDSLANEFTTVHVGVQAGSSANP